MRRSGFSLASLFVLIAVAAVLANAVQMAVVQQDRLNNGMATLMVGAGAAIGLIVGLAMGIGHHGSFWGVAASTFTGYVAGGLAGILMVVPESIWSIVVGSAIMVLFAASVRRFSRRAAEPQPREFAEGTKP